MLIELRWNIEIWRFNLDICLGLRAQIWHDFYLNGDTSHQLVGSTLLPLIRINTQIGWQHFSLLLCQRSYPVIFNWMKLKNLVRKLWNEILSKKLLQTVHVAKDLLLKSVGFRPWYDLQYGFIARYVMSKKLILFSSKASQKYSHQVKNYRVIRNRRANKSSL